MNNLSQKQKNVIIAIGVIIGIFIIYKVYFSENIEYEEFEQTENVIIPYEEEENISSEDKKENLDKTIFVHIAGAISDEGLIEIKENSRIADAIELAGGVRDDADLSNVNLAFVLEDGMKITIPSKNDEFINQDEYITTENGENIITGSNTESKGSEKGLININIATQSELETLPGIGTSTATKIINYRDENGKFKTVEDIKNVKGIGEAKYENIKSLITVQ